MFNKAQAQNLIEFLDRVTIKGHDERIAMNDIVNTLLQANKTTTVTGENNVKDNNDISG